MMDDDCPAVIQYLVDMDGLAENFEGFKQVWGEVTGVRIFLKAVLQ